MLKFLLATDNFLNIFLKIYRDRYMLLIDNSKEKISKILRKLIFIHYPKDSLYQF